MYDETLLDLITHQQEQIERLTELARKSKKFIPCLESAYRDLEYYEKLYDMDSLITFHGSCWSDFDEEEIKLCDLEEDEFETYTVNETWYNFRTGQYETIEKTKQRRRVAA